MVLLGRLLVAALALLSMTYYWYLVSHFCHCNFYGHHYYSVALLANIVIIGLITNFSRMSHPDTTEISQMLYLVMPQVLCLGCL